MDKVSKIKEDHINLRNYVIKFNEIFASAIKVVVHSDQEKQMEIKVISYDFISVIFCRL